MPSLSGKYDNNVGIILQVGILNSGEAMSPGQVQAPVFAALVDTGATTTCISETVASAVNLRPTGKQPMVSATETVAVNQYLVHVLLPFGTAGFVQQNLPVLSFTPHDHAPFQILLGRDIIGRGVLTVAFDGSYTFSI